MKRLLALGCCIALAACSGPARGPQSDWEREHEARLAAAASKPADAAVAPPPYPGGRGLLEFYVAATSGFRFFIDPATLDVGGGVVRYVLVARSDAGAENVSFEVMRCATREVRVYAVGQDGRWGGRPGEWRPIAPRSVQRWHNALYREFFCPQGEVVITADDAISALRTRGMRPLPPDLGF